MLLWLTAQMENLTQDLFFQNCLQLGEEVQGCMEHVNLLLRTESLTPISNRPLYTKL